MDLYKILQIKENATNIEIKKAFRKLASIYHPDKPTGNEEKFKQINIAYEILSNENKKKEYDEMNYVNRIKLYDMFNAIIPNKYNSTINTVINFFYDDTNDLKKDVNDMDFNTIKSKVLNKLAYSNIIEMLKTTYESNTTDKSYEPIKDNNDDIESYEPIKDNDNNTKIVEPIKDNDNNTKIVEPIKNNDDIESYEPIKNNDDIESYEPIKNIVEPIDDDIYECHDKELDVFGYINVDLSEKYCKKYRKINVRRIRDGILEDKQFIIPILSDEFIIDNEGDKECDSFGNLSILIKENEDQIFKKVGEYDLMIKKKITFYDYLEGFIFDLVLPDKNILEIHNKNPQMSGLIDVYKGYGMPYDYNTITRGNLIIKYIIEVENISLDKKKIYDVFGSNFEHSM